MRRREEKGLDTKRGEGKGPGKMLLESSSRWIRKGADLDITGDRPHTSESDSREDKSEKETCKRRDYRQGKKKNTFTVIS